MKKEIHKFIDLSNLPRNYKGIDWINTIGYKVYFEYDDIKDWIEVINFSKNDSKVTIKYEDLIGDINCGNLKKCKLGGFLRKYTNKFKIENKTTIVDDNRNLTILNRKYITKTKDNNDIQHYKYYEYHCNICGARLWMEESQLLRGAKCSCCNGNTVIKGINDIATTHPHLVKYFVNIEDAYTHTYGSTDKAWVKCPDCGFKKITKICRLHSQGFSCNKCSDGISFPEKFMRSVLDQIGVDFICQYSNIYEEWCGKYRYDFYFELNSEKYIIETHGEQHYKENSRFKMSLDEVIKNDKVKKELALQNGIKEENYIVINCCESSLKWIKEHLLNSELNKIFNMDNIDWNKCDEESQNNLAKKICEYWNNKQDNETTLNLCKIFKIGRCAVLKYLKQGTRLGWCYYNAKEEMKKNNERTTKINKKRLSKQVEIFKDGYSLGVFESCHELENQSEKLFGVKLGYSAISRVCRGVINTYKGFSFKYI